MNVIKRFSVMALTAISMSLGAGNFYLVNSNPKTPVYYSINNGVLKGLGGAHIGESRTVKKGQNLQITFSAKADGSKPTYFAFVPGQKTCFIQVHVGRDGKIVINPQTTVKPTAIKCTKARCAVKAKPSSTRNITQQEIDQIQAQAQALAAYSAAPVAAAAAAPAPADDDLALAIARSLEDQKQAAPAPAPRDEYQAAPAPEDEDQAAPAPAPRPRDLAPQQQDGPAKLPSYDQALVIVPQPAPVDMAASAQPAPVTVDPAAPVAQPEQPAELVELAAAAAAPAQDAVGAKVVDQPSDFADESSEATRNLVAAPVTVDPAAPVAQPEQPAELVELAAAAAAAQDAVGAKPEFEDPVIERLKDGKLSAEQLKAYRQYASNILTFFHSEESKKVGAIGKWLNAAKENNNIAELTKLIKNLMQPNKEEFEAAVKDILKQVPNGLINGKIQTQRCIDSIFNNILPKHAAVNEIITASIVELYNTQPDFVGNNRDNLSELLTQWENHLQHSAPNVAAIWQELKPLSKIYYLKLIPFYFEAQSTLEGMASAAPQQ